MVCKWNLGRIFGAGKMHFSPLVAKAAVRPKAVVLLLLIYCFMYFPLLVGILCLSLICNALLYVYFSFAIILNRKRELVALLLVSNSCLVTVNIMWLFLFLLVYSV